MTLRGGWRLKQSVEKGVEPLLFLPTLQRPGCRAQPAG